MELKFNNVPYKYNISASFINAYEDMEVRGDCKYKFFRTKIKKDVDEKIDKAAFDIGKWFEYKVTGAIPRGYKEAPTPEFTKAKELTAAYKNILPQIEMAKKMLKVEGEYKINLMWQYGKLKGYPDVVVPNKIIDIKTSGYIDNDWEEYGWGYKNLQHRKSMNQAKMYKLLDILCNNGNSEFYFWVFDTTKEGLVKNIHVNIVDDVLQKFVNTINMIEQNIDYYISTNGFEPVSKYNVCKDCPVLDCKDRIVLPEVYELTL